MGNTVIPRRQGGSYTTIEFENCEVKTLEKHDLENLTVGRSELAAASVGNYALFAGGRAYNGGSYYSPVVDAYNISLIHSTPTELNAGRLELAATGGQGYALFGGGFGSKGSDTYYSTVDAYSENLVHTMPNELSEGRYRLAATTNGTYSLFAGGQNYYTDTNFATVDAYDNNLVHSTAVDLTAERARLAVTRVANYALFAGGLWYKEGSGYGRRNVDVYNDSLVHSTAADLYDMVDYLGATSLENYAIFNSWDNWIDVYDSNLAKMTLIYWAQGGSHLAATTNGCFALFGGGGYGSRFTSRLAGLDKNLVFHQFEDLSEARGELAATTVGNYALFGGGSSPTTTATVDCYEYVEKDLELTLYKGTRYKFQGMDAEATVEVGMETKTIATPATGYIKLKKATLS